MAQEEIQNRHFNVKVSHINFLKSIQTAWSKDGRGVPQNNMLLISPEKKSFEIFLYCSLNVLNQKTCECNLAKQIASNFCKPSASLDLVRIETDTFYLNGWFREFIYWFPQR